MTTWTNFPRRLSRLLREDPSLRVKLDRETGQTILSGMGELHLEIIVDRLLREFQVEAVGRRTRGCVPRDINADVRINYRHVKQTGGKGQFAEVVIEIKPLARGWDFEFIDKITGGAIPKEYIRPVEEGIKWAMESGVVAAYPVVDVGVTLVDGKYHEVDSSEMAFKMAGFMAFKEACSKGGSYPARAHNGC